MSWWQTGKATRARGRSDDAPRIGGRELLAVALGASILISFAITVDLLSPVPGGLGRRLLAGDIADRDYKAPADLTLVDEAATAEHRRLALESAPVVYDWNERWGGELLGRIDAAFTAARGLEAERAAGEADAEQSPIGVFLQALEPKGEIPEAIQRRLVESRFAARDRSELVRLLRPVLPVQIVGDPEEFGRQTEKRRVIVRELGSGEERVLEDTGAVLAPAAARALVAEEAKAVLKDEARARRNALVALAQALVDPNLSFNLRATDERRQAVAANVKEVTFSLRKGEIIVRDGDPVSESHVAILEGVRARFATVTQIGPFLGAAVLILVVLVAMWRFGQRDVQRFPTAPGDAIFLMAILVAAALGTKLGLFIVDAIAQNPDFQGLVGDEHVALHYLIPVAAATMLVRLVHSAETALLFAMVAAPLAGLQVGGSISFTLYTLIGSLVAAMGAARVTQRGTLLRAGAAVGITNMGVILAVLLTQEAPNTAREVLVLTAAGLLSGCFAGGMVSALAPLVESVFGYTTDVKLLELANREQPLLRELEIRAPGTYHHSMMVGHLAEKASEIIGANALLAKVGGYYHDIGKMRRPHFFVENVTIHQGENRHEKLSPSMSARIIQAHVKDGLELGRAHKLVPGIMQSIGQHHGTSIIRYFYEKAKELVDPEKGENVEEHEYRYPGPKPQSREAGILMLADSVEAASRTLPDMSPPRVQQLVQRIINNYFRDGQLDECSLTLRDLHSIARSFIDTLSAIRHERIDYPEATDSEGKPLDESGDEGVVERLEPRKKDRQDAAAEKRGDDLKRLGLS